jgi:hypothetical protein
VLCGWLGSKRQFRVRDSPEILGQVKNISMRLYLGQGLAWYVKPDRETRRCLHIAEMDPMNDENGKERNSTARHPYESGWWPRTSSTRSERGRIHSDASRIASRQSIWAPWWKRITQVQPHQWD